MGGVRRGNHRHSHPQNNTLLTSFSPFMGMGLMDDFFSPTPSNGFSSISSMSFSNGSSNGALKRTSTSTTFVNGKKLMTRKYVRNLDEDPEQLINLIFNFFHFRTYENGKETILKYENDVLKSKTVNGVQQALSYN